MNKTLPTKENVHWELFFERIYREMLLESFHCIPNDQLMIHLLF